MERCIVDSRRAKNTIKSQVMMMPIEIMKQSWVYIHPFWNLSFQRTFTPHRPLLQLTIWWSIDVACQKQNQKSGVDDTHRNNETIMSRYTPLLEPEVLQCCNPHKIYSTYALMMKRSIVDSWRVDIRQTPRAATDMFYLLSVEISRLHPLLGDLNPEVPENLYPS